MIAHHLFRSGNSVQLLRSGDEYFFRLIELIQQAKNSIHLQVYIFQLDTTGEKILDALKQAVLRGVNVYLVVDGYASPHITPSIAKQLMHAGIYTKRFAPLHYKKLTIGRRLHHKIVLIDEQIALVGGINIANKYSGWDGQKPWLDMAVQVSGPICIDLLKICTGTWPKRMRNKWGKSMHPSFTSNLHMRVLQNDWWRKNIEISSAYRNIIRKSQSELWIVASYFLPGFRLRHLLKKAAQRGVQIHLITGGHSDVPLMKAAVQYLYHRLLKLNVRIYEWQPSVLHGKMAVADGKWSTVGSYNLNALSDYGSLELNIEVLDDTFAYNTKQFLEQMIDEGCVEITSKNFGRNNSILKQASRWISYKLMRLSLAVIFILMRRDRIKIKPTA